MPFSRVRKVIADNMVKAKRTAAHTHCFDEVDMSAIVALSDLPSGENSTPPASVERLVTCLAFEPSGPMSQICAEPPRSEMNAIDFESGDHRGRSLSEPSCVIWVGVPPVIGST